MKAQRSFATRPADAFIIGILACLMCIAIFFPLMWDPTALGIKPEHVRIANSMWAMLMIVSLVLAWTGLKQMNRKGR